MAHPGLHKVEFETSGNHFLMEQISVFLQSYSIQMNRFENHRHIVRLAVPIILANASAPLLGLADTATIGQTGHAADLGAIALATLVFSFVYWGFSFLRMGTTGFMAQAAGASNKKEVITVAYRSVLLGLAIGVTLILLQFFIGKLALWLMSASDEVKALVMDYFYIRIWGAPATLMTYAILGSLIGLSWTKELLWVQLLLNGTNIALNILFVLGAGLGIKGIALGTLIAEWIAFFYAGHLLIRNLNIRDLWQQFRDHWQQIINKAKLLAVFKVNTDIMLRTLALLSGFAWFADQGAKLGDTTLAANHVLLQFVSLSAFFLDGFAHVSEMLSGKAIGANDKDGFIKQFRHSTQLAGITAVVLALGIIVFSPFTIGLLTKDADVQKVAMEHAVYAGIYILLSFVAFQLDGVFIGATKSKEMRNSTLISFIILVGVGTVMMQYYGNAGLWISFVVYVVARGIFLGLYVPKIMRESF